MARTIRIGWCAVLMLFLAGCAYQRRVELSSPSQPEQIYISQQLKDYRQSRVGVFTFSEPSYATGMGRVAAESIYHELLKKRVFSTVTDEDTLSNSCSAFVNDLARSKGYDIAITGELLYYFNGSAFQPSRVIERIKVVHVPTEEILWYATAREIGPPAPDIDFIFFRTVGYPAPSTRLLLERNAEKFCNMLLGKPQPLSNQGGI